MFRETQLVIGPNASLSVAQAWLFMGFMSAVGLGIGGVMALKGLWPILPFAGLELVALGAALFVSVHRNGYREVLRFTEDTVVVEFGMLGRGAVASFSLSRYWTRVVLEAGANAHAPTRLLLCCSGQKVELGRCLTDEERERLHGRIRDLLSLPGVQPGVQPV